MADREMASRLQGVLQFLRENQFSRAEASLVAEVELSYQQRIRECGGDGGHNIDVIAAALESESVAPPSPSAAPSAFAARVDALTRDFDAALAMGGEGDAEDEKDGGIAAPAVAAAQRTDTAPNVDVDTQTSHAHAQSPQGGVSVSDVGEENPVDGVQGGTLRRRRQDDDDDDDAVDEGKCPYKEEEEEEDGIISAAALGARSQSQSREEEEEEEEDGAAAADCLPISLGKGEDGNAFASYSEANEVEEQQLDEEEESPPTSEQRQDGSWSAMECTRSRPGAHPAVEAEDVEDALGSVEEANVLIGGASPASHRRLLREWQANPVNEYEDCEDAGYYRVEVLPEDEAEFLRREVEGWAEELEMHARARGETEGRVQGEGRHHDHDHDQPAVGEDPAVTGPSSRDGGGGGGYGQTVSSGGEERRFYGEEAAASKAMKASEKATIGGIFSKVEGWSADYVDGSGVDGDGGHEQTVSGGGGGGLDFAFYTHESPPLGSLTPASDAAAGGPTLGWGGSEFGGSSHSPLEGGTTPLSSSGTNLADLDSAADALRAWADSGGSSYGQTVSGGGGGGGDARRSHLSHFSEAENETPPNVDAGEADDFGACGKVAAGEEVEATATTDVMDVAADDESEEGTGEEDGLSPEEAEALRRAGASFQPATRDSNATAGSGARAGDDESAAAFTAGGKFAAVLDKLGAEVSADDGEGKCAYDDGDDDSDSDEVISAHRFGEGAQRTPTSEAGRRGGGGTGGGGVFSSGGGSHLRQGGSGVAPSTGGSSKMSAKSDRSEAAVDPDHDPDSDPSNFTTFNLRVVHRLNRTGFEEHKEFPVQLGSVVAGRYQLIEYLGSAAFSKAVQALDLQTGMLVCMKIIKNNKDFFDQSLDEVKLLKLINQRDPADTKGLLRLYDYFYHREHLFIVTELLRANLYEFQKFNLESGDEPYFTLGSLRSIARQVLESLEFLHSLDLIHCDLKPENILIKSYSRCEVKVIDLGSSCFVTDHLSSYVQSRSYRAPEVILGARYSTKVDVWSLGCILAELHTGDVLFQNDSLGSLLARAVGILGPFDPELLARGRYSSRFFTRSGLVYERDKESGTLHVLQPKKTTLSSQLGFGGGAAGNGGGERAGFTDFLLWMLQPNPDSRPTATEALSHPWLSMPSQGSDEDAAAGDARQRSLASQL